MGSVLGGIGSVFGGAAGGIAQGAGATNNYDARNPYSTQNIQDLINQQGSIYNSQGNLAQALQAQVAGQGPNPAQTQYLQNVGSNLANTQGLIASQRGLNPALATRMGANQATSSNNQAALAAALLQQQQQLGATANLGNLYGQMQQGNLGAQGLFNQANLGASGINQQVAGENAKIRGQLAGGLIQGVAGAGAAAAGGGAGAAHGALISGKANVSGDSPQNDKVPIMASPGEIVVPRSKANDPEKAKEFVAHLLKSKDKKDGDEQGDKYGSVLEHRRKIKDLEKRIKALEKKKSA